MFATLKETRILFLIGSVDLLLTLILFNVAGFDASIEENNIFSKILAESPYLFALMKVGSLVVFLSIIELVWQKGWIEQQKTKKYLKIAVVAYIGLWIFSVIKVNILPLL